MKQLKLFNLDQAHGIRQPSSDTLVHARSPASVIFTDFDVQMPVVVTSSASAVDVEGLMQKAHVKLMLVLDASDHFVGVISLADLSEDCLIRAVAGGIQRSEVQVHDLMQPRARLHALGYEELRHATVQDVLHTLRDERAQHALVVDEKTHEVRGLISASDVARKLHLPLPLGTVLEFTQVNAALHRQPELRRYA
jgi:CBS domain containing-hemolysin-like protein